MKAPSGELLQIWRFDDWDEVESDSDSEHQLDDESRTLKTSMVKVHKADLTSRHLVEQSGLSDHVLFFGLNQSHCLLAEDYPQLKANHAYFSDDDYLGITWCNKEKHHIGVFDIENSCKEEIVSPQLWSNSPTPTFNYCCRSDASFIEGENLVLDSSYHIKVNPFHGLLTSKQKQIKQNLLFIRKL